MRDTPTGRSIVRDRRARLLRGHVLACAAYDLLLDAAVELKGAGLGGEVDFAASLRGIREGIARLDREARAEPVVGPPTPPDRDYWGRVVHEARAQWARDRRQPDPGSTIPYERASEMDREGDRQVAEAVLERAREVLPVPARPARGKGGSA